MTTQYDSGFATFIASKALAIFRRVKMSSTTNRTITYADAGEEYLGVTQAAAAAAGDPVTVKLFNSPGTFKVEAASAMATRNCAVYGAADGKVDDAASGNQIGLALDTASGAGAIIEMAAVLDAGIIGERTFGNVLSGGSYQLTHAVSTTKNYPLGTKRESNDGRIWRYSKALGVAHAGFGAWFDAPVTISHALPTQTGAATGLAGCSVVKVTVDSNDGFTGNGSLAADELVGGYIVIGNGGGGEATVQQRIITANTAVAASGGTTFITLDAPLTIGVSGSDYCEVIDNPWGHMRGGLTSASGEKASFGGVPASLTAANDYFWLQSEGPSWVCPNSNPGSSAADRTVYWNANGTVIGGEDATVESGRQRAGYIMENSAAGDGPPFVYLQME